MSNPAVPPYWTSAVGHLCAADPVLAAVIAAYPGEALAPRDDAFGTLARSVVGQQISVAAAASVWRRLEGTIGAVTPATIADATPEALRAAGLSRAKVAYVQDLARHFLDRTVDPERWRRLDDEEVIEELTRVKGIGRWTAEMFLIFHLLRPDVLPVADLGLQRAMARHYGDDVRLARAQMTARAAPWRPWRSVATWYLWRSLDPLPVVY